MMKIEVKYGHYKVSYKKYVVFSYNLDMALLQMSAILMKRGEINGLSN